METTQEQETRLLHQIVPPRLEDAGLEDCALPPDSIKEAFFKAASAVKTRAASIFSADDDKDDAACVKDPWPTAKDTSDAVIGIEPENEASGPCTVEKGCEIGADKVKVFGGGGGIEEEEIGDKVVVGDGGVKLGEEGKACVGDSQGLGIEGDVKNGGSDEGKEKEGKRPTLVEGFV
ncbi:uncharacterized protein G2W53_000257 [Senna tora]|uniref:Uncharacterized protein n=1 Tax=Senna tora TaxID=362788 RepID=A0A834XFI2_9FABA|nr:uncharacterized protein G2W53_000257 [Senna tora]